MVTATQNDAKDSVRRCCAGPFLCACAGCGGGGIMREDFFEKFFSEMNGWGGLDRILSERLFKEVLFMKKRKKILALILVGLLLVAAVPAAGFAHAGGHGIGHFVDVNGDGVCDNRGTVCGDYVDANGDGVCDNRGMGCGDYVDTNGDGVCDNHGTGCGDYVDANGDGVCDNVGAGGGHHAAGHHGGGHHGGRW